MTPRRIRRAVTGFLACFNIAFCGLTPICALPMLAVIEEDELRMAKIGFYFWLVEHAYRKGWDGGNLTLISLWT